MTKTYIIDTLEKVGDEVVLKGWVETIRDLGKFAFMDLRDSTGVLQIIAEKELAKDVKRESLLEITGEVKKRGEKNVNKEMKTGEIELKASELSVISESKTPPFPLIDEGYDIDEGLRLKYRYLDLRRSRLQKNLKVRDKFLRKVRNFLYGKDFTEIETPLLTKSTPEGSRDFVVPSRLQKGKFYALPQSPQQYKQLLMVAGFERYFQIAKCLRDEDLRADRSFEHTQIDLEASFVTREEVMSLVEEMMIEVVEDLGAEIKQKPFPVITHEEAIKKYGDDKFDLRNEEEKKENVLAFAWVVDFPFFEEEDGSWTFTHNPFSDPVPEQKKKFLEGEVEGIKATQYDLVCNGYELGGGSIRSSEPEVLRRVFEVLGYSESEIEREFSHLLEAFEYGAPPHGGIALGLERILTILLDEKGIREVTAFPMSYTGKTSVMDAPERISSDQLDELGLEINE